jgi:hypothetical protein
MAQAAHDCRAFAADTSAFANDATELFALGQLCLFGQQFEPARSALVSYLALPKPPQREQALEQLVRAFLGLKEPMNAEAQVSSLLRDYPYDTPIHLAIDQVIDEVEGEHVEGEDGGINNLALKLCAAQNAATLPLLASGKALDDKAGGASAATLFADAVRCDALARAAGEPGNLLQLGSIVQQPNWAGTRDLARMQAALNRQLMVGARFSLAAIHARSLGPNALVPHTLSLTRGAVLLVPFTLWSPSFPEVARDLARLAPQQPIYAITSWRANTGGDDVPSDQVLDGLRSWQKILPRRVSILVVPDAELDAFYADTFPAGILISNGIVLSNGVLASEGAERFLMNPLRDKAGDRTQKNSPARANLQHARANH